MKKAYYAVNKELGILACGHDKDIVTKHAKETSERYELHHWSTHQMNDFCQNLSTTALLHTAVTLIDQLTKRMIRSQTN